MNFLKTLLFLACIASTSAILGMHKLVENESDLTEFQKKQYSDIMNTLKDSEALSFERFSTIELSQALGEAEIYSNSYYPKDEEYLKKMNGAKILDFIRFNSIQDPDKITRLHCFINYTNLERPMRTKIHNEYFTALTNTDSKNNQLQKQNENLAQRNEKLTERIEELTERNKALEEGLNTITAAKVTKTIKINDRIEKLKSFFWQPRNILLGLGGWLLLGGAWAYSSFK